MDLTNILVISGKPDLSELVSQTKGGAIVKNLVTGQKYPVFKNDRISSLGEIRLFTDSDERPLEDVMQAIYKHLDGKPTAFEPKKAGSCPPRLRPRPRPHLRHEETLLMVQYSLRRRKDYLRRREREECLNA